MAVWDMYGLESLHDVGKAKQEIKEWEKKKIWYTLKGETVPKKPSMDSMIPLQALLLRAQANTQRCYEIYEFTTEMTYNQVKSYFEESPQVMADTIRNVGYKVYSCRLTNKDRVIV